MKELRTVIPTNWCAFCGGTHELTNEVCKFCNLCWRLCIREADCRWKDETRNYEKEAAQSQQVDVNKVVESVALANAQEAFECWLASSDKIEINQGETVEGLWKEFELFAREVLQPVDGKKQYLQIASEGGKVKSFDFLDAGLLFKNQDGDYIVVDGKKRVRIGKQVAVIG